MVSRKFLPLKNRKKFLMVLVGMMGISYALTMVVRQIFDLWTPYTIAWCSALIPVSVTTILTGFVLSIEEVLRKKTSQTILLFSLYAHVLFGQLVTMAISVLQ